MKKFLLSALAIILAMGMIGSSFAYFSDVETSTGNTFIAGTLDLKIKDIDTGFFVDEVQTWTLMDWTPGESTAYGNFPLIEVGTLTANDLEIGCDYTATEGEPYGEGTPDTVDTSLVPDSFAKYVEITQLIYQDDTWDIRYDGTDWYTLKGYPTPPDGYDPGDWEVADTDGVAGLSLADLHNDPLKHLPAPDGNVVFNFEIWLAFGDAGNDLQGDTLHVTMSFTLNQ